MANDGQQSSQYYRQMSLIGEQLRTLINSKKTVAFVYGNITSVDKENECVDATTGKGVTLQGISLRLTNGGVGSVLLFPKVDSLVIIGFVQDRPELSWIVGYSELDGISAAIENVSIAMTKDGIETDIDGGTISITKDTVDIFGNLTISK